MRDISYPMLRLSCNAPSLCVGKKKTLLLVQRIRYFEIEVLITKMW